MRKSTISSNRMNSLTNLHKKKCFVFTYYQSVLMIHTYLNDTRIYSHVFVSHNSGQRHDKRI